MLIAPTQSATPMPRQVNRRIYFHTIIAASKALFTCPSEIKTRPRLPGTGISNAEGSAVRLRRKTKRTRRGTSRALLKITLVAA
jgi:hypothetical protein